MHLTIEVPDEYAEAVRARLDALGYNDSPRQVRRVLRYTIAHLLVLWWQDRREWKLRVPSADGTLGAELPALTVPPTQEQRRATVIPVTAFGAVNHPREEEATATEDTNGVDAGDTGARTGR